MRSRTILPALLALAFLPLACGPAEPENKLVHDFGVLPTSVREVRHAFRLTNGSGEAWDVRRIASSCACLLADQEPFRLEPGDTRTIHVTTSVDGIAGKFRYHVRLFCDRFAEGRLDLVVEGMVRRSVTVMPPLVDLGSVVAGTTFERELVLNAPGEDIRIEPASEPWMSGTALRRVTPRGPQNLVVLRGTVPPGEAFEGALVLTVRGSVEETLTVPVRGRAPRRLRLEPSYVALGPDSREASVRVVTLAHGTPTVSPPAGLDAALLPAGPGRHRIDVRLGSPGPGPGIHRFDVRLGSHTASLAVEVLP